LEEGPPRARRQRLPVELGPFALGIPRIDKAGLSVRLGDVVDPRADAAQCPFHEDQVPLLGEPLTELLGKMSGRRRGPGQDHDSRRGPIEPVDEPEKRLAPFLSSQPLLTQRYHVGVAGMVGLRKEARGLVNHQ
jgi:hypothetical protein